MGLQLFFVEIWAFKDYFVSGRFTYVAGRMDWQGIGCVAIAGGDGVHCVGELAFGGKSVCGRLTVGILPCAPSCRSRVSPSQFGSRGRIQGLHITKGGHQANFCLGTRWSLKADVFGRLRCACGKSLACSLTMRHRLKGSSSAWKFAFITGEYATDRNVTGDHNASIVFTWPSPDREKCARSVP